MPPQPVPHAAPPHVPPRARRKFVIVWTCVLAVGVAMIALHPLLKGEAVDVVPTLGVLWMMSALMLMMMAEQYLRRETLPAPGHKPWCCRISLMILAIMLGITALMAANSPHIPGLGRATNQGTMSLLGKWPDPSTMEYVETSISSGSLPGTPPSYTLSSIRFHPPGHPEKPGWIIRRSEGILRHEKDGRTLPWNSAGMFRMAEDLASRDIGPEQDTAMLATVDSWCRDWTAGKPSPWFYMSSPRHGSEARQPWVIPAMAGITLIFLAAGIHFTARATMGIGPEVPDP